MKNKTGLSDSTRKELIQRFLHKKPGLVEVKDNLSQQKTATGIPDKFCDFKSFEGYEKLRISQTAAKKMGVVNPFFKVHEGVGAATTQVDGRALINFSSYNYLGLAGHAAVNKAAVEAIAKYGTSASASRVVAGERPIQRELEKELAAFYGTEDCVVFVSGHATNVTTIGCLFGRKDLIIHDALIHNSVIEGIKLSGAARRSFAHNDYKALEEILVDIRGQFERVLIVVEGLYSMDGDIPDMPQFIDIKSRFKAFLMVDDAHSLGVLGIKGGGAREHFNLKGPEVDIWMGTLSKTLAGCGGYICGPKALVGYLKYASSGFVYSVGISPPLAAASLAALRILKSEPERVVRLHSHGQKFLDVAKSKGFDTGLSEGYAITPIIVKSSLKAVKLSNQLFERGINAQPIIYPAVEERSARLRFFLSSEHTEEQIEETLSVLSDIL